MATYELTDPQSGQTFQADFDNTPSDKDIDEVVSSYRQKSTPLAQPTNTPAPATPRATSDISTPDDETQASSPAYQFTAAPPASPEKTTVLGTAAGEAARNVVPLAAAVGATKIAAPFTRSAGAWAGARVGAIGGAFIPGLGETGIGEGIGGILGGLVGFLAPGFIASVAAKKAQTDIANKLAPESILGSKVEQEQEEQHPIVAAVAPLLMLGKPNPMNVVRAGRTLATTEGRAALGALFKAGANKEALDAWTAATAPDIKREVGNVLSVAQAGTINAAFNAADQIQSGHYSFPQLAEAAAAGTLFNAPWIKERNPQTDHFDATKPPVEESENQNASNEPGSESVLSHPQGQSVDETAPLRQQGQTAQASEEVQPEAQPQPNVTQPEVLAPPNPTIQNVPSTTGQPEIVPTKAQSVSVGTTFVPKNPETLQSPSLNPEFSDIHDAARKAARDDVSSSMRSEANPKTTKPPGQPFSEIRKQWDLAYNDEWQKATATQSELLRGIQSPLATQPNVPTPPGTSKLSIVTPAIKTSRKVYRGQEGETHDDIIARVRSELGYPKLKKFDAARGFIDSEGRFIANRGQAAQIAIAAGQVPNTIKELHSEDFWQAKGIPLKNKPAALSRDATNPEQSAVPKARRLQQLRAIPADQLTPEQASEKAALEAESSEVSRRMAEQMKAELTKTKQSQEEKPLWQLAGYKDEKTAGRDFQKNRLAENDETEDEFLRRRYCSGKGSAMTSALSE